MSTPFPEMTDAEILAAFPAQPPKPISAYTAAELAPLAKFGPATIGGALYLAARSVSAQSAGGKYGPAILSKSAEPVEFVSLREEREALARQHAAAPPPASPKGKKAA